MSPFVPHTRRWIRQLAVAALLMAPAASRAAEAEPDEAPAAKKAPEKKAEPAAAKPQAKADGKDGKKPREEALAPATPEMFDEALALLRAGNERDAAPKFYDFIRRSPRTADNYEPAELFLAEALLKLGFTHAAAVYDADVARTRARVETLPDALKTLEKLSQGPHDEELIEREVLANTDFGVVPSEVSDFVNFHKGMTAFRDGQLKWANFHFDKVKPSTVYGARVRLVRAADRLNRAGEVDAALADFEALAADAKAPKEVRNEARISAARLRYEKKDFDAAQRLYDSMELSELDAGRGQVYLEKAWTSYEQRDLSRSMGLLLALDAPSFRDIFLPEKYVLRAFIYKDRCHYLAAKRAARDFNHRYRAALTLIRNRGELSEDPRLVRAAFELDPSARRADAFLQQLTRERDAADAYVGRFQASGLTSQLRAVYDRALSEATRRRTLAVKKALEDAADKVLRQAEQVRLLDYEIGLDLYKRVKKGTLAQQIVDEEDGPFVAEREVAYDFDGEYWNDELRDYRFELANRCKAEVSSR